MVTNSLSPVAFWHQNATSDKEFCHHHSWKVPVQYCCIRLVGAYLYRGIQARYTARQQQDRSANPLVTARRNSKRSHVGVRVGAGLCDRAAGRTRPLGTAPGAGPLLSPWSFPTAAPSRRCCVSLCSRRQSPRPLRWRCGAGSRSVAQVTSPYGAVRRPLGAFSGSSYASPSAPCDPTAARCPLSLSAAARPLVRWYPLQPYRYRYP